MNDKQQYPAWQKSIREAQAERNAELAAEDARREAEREARERHEQAADGRILAAVLEGFGIEVGELSHGRAIVGEYVFLLTSRWARKNVKGAEDDATHELRFTIKALHVDDVLDFDLHDVPVIDATVPARITGDFEQVELAARFSQHTKARFADMLDEADRKARQHLDWLAHVAAEEAAEAEAAANPEPAPAPKSDTPIAHDGLTTLAELVENVRGDVGDTDYVQALAALEIAAQLRRIAAALAGIEKYGMGQAYEY